jgi:hypothetical protein
LEKLIKFSTKRLKKSTYTFVTLLGSQFNLKEKNNFQATDKAFSNQFFFFFLKQSKCFDKKMASISRVLTF